MYRNAARYTIASGVAFFVMCAYMIWSPDNGFTGGADDDFEQKLLMTWLLFGVVGSICMWALAELINWMKKEEES